MNTVETNDLLSQILVKIDENAVTASDFDKLISESTPESVRDRVRRRTLHNATDSHIDDDGHQSLTLPSFKKRIDPKRKPTNVQSNGRGDIGHDHSVKTQQRQRQAHVNESVDFITSYMNKQIDELLLYKISDKSVLKETAIKLRSKDNINKEWIDSLVNLVESTEETEESAKAQALTSKLGHVRDGMFVCSKCGNRFYTTESAKKCCEGKFMALRGMKHG